MELSPLQTARYTYEPKLPPVLKSSISAIQLSLGEPTESIADQAALKAQFSKTYGKPIATFVSGRNAEPSKDLRVGVILSGGQAPGGHNVITGLYDGLKKINPKSTLYGFLGGPSGLIDNQAVEFDDSFIDRFRNTGGFDIIGSGRTKIETDEQFLSVLKTAQERKLNAVVVIGGDDSNTNAALLAEYFVAEGTDIQVIGVPKTIDGDLKNEYIETSFGFDTACKTYSELIGNICRDANSAKKYWHFIKLMGRSASHIALECALQTRPNVALISEEVEANKQSLGSIVDSIAEVVKKRSSKGENFGIVLVPEGLIEFIPEMKVLISELNDLLAHHTDDFAVLKGFQAQYEFVHGKLSSSSAQAFSSLPQGIRAQLMADRDPHGNVQVSLIDTEKLLIQMVGEKLAAERASGTFNGKFSGLAHFFGYEGRCAFPSNFDADYCYSLGYTACLLINSGLTGYISSVRNMARPSSEWVAGGIPLTMMMNREKRHGKDKPVIRKALVELDGAPFKELVKNRDQWATQTSYRYPGAIQYYGPSEVCDQPTITLALEQKA
ncbi:MAG: diphosphate--fructose-6-phosphate 1-phosphotransferase [Spirochaetales bacterium]|nr:diphosphate--fructose-6-phosphate 1-phosphotransferase [Spirochaetales bacterium]